MKSFILKAGLVALLSGGLTYYFSPDPIWEQLGGEDNLFAESKLNYWRGLSECAKYHF